MSMPGFVFHLACASCLKTSMDYPLYVFPLWNRSDLLLPAWSRSHRCYMEIQCFLSPEDRTNLEDDRAQLRSFVDSLSSEHITVGVPLWSIKEGQIQVRVAPSPICPHCGLNAEALLGYPPQRPVAIVKDIRDPYGVPLPALQLSIRATNCLESEGITNVGEVCERTAAGLLSMRNFGEATLEEVRETLSAHGLRLTGE